MNYMYEAGQDVPNKPYPKHRHEATHLITLQGSIKLAIDGGELKEYGLGDHILVPANTDHEGIVGPDGWKYVAVWDEDEAKAYQDVDH